MSDWFSSTKAYRSYGTIWYHFQLLYGLFGRKKTAKNGQIQLILFLFLCVVRMIHAAIMVSDAAPNVAFRSCKSLLLLDTHTYTHAGTDMHSVIFEFPWQFGIAALACYMFGVAHTLSDVSPNCATSICISQQSHHLKCSIFYTL